MPTKDTNDSGKNTDATEPKVTDDVNDGDILEQLKSDSASSANLYKLELKMYKAVDRMDKTLTKEHKLLTQSKKSLDSMSTNLASISKDSGIVRSTLSSVDTTLKQMYQLLDRIQSGGAIATPRSKTEKDSARTVDLLSSLERKLANEYRSQEDLDRQYSEGDITEEEYLDSLADLQDSIDLLTEKLGDARQSLADILDRYDGFDTFDEKSEKRLREILEQYQSNEIDKTDLDYQLRGLATVIDAHKDTLKAAEDRWKDDGEYGFEKRAKQREEAIRADFEARRAELEARFDRAVPDSDGSVMTPADFEQRITDLIAERDEALSSVAGSISSSVKIGKDIDRALEKIATGKTYDERTGKNTTASTVTETLGSIGGTLVGAEVGAAIGTAIGGPIGTVVGGLLGEFVGSKIEALSTLIGDRLDYLANHAKKTRDEILQAGFEKIRNDVKDMATYSIEIYESATRDLYAAWDKNLGQITATQGYTKEALNSLQDAVAQRLQAEGYGNTIDASKFLDQLANTLNANLGGPLAEAFAAQNLILQKAVPEVDLSASAAQFAAIYANANQQGVSGEDTMIAAMNEIVGAAKALESVTEGNNQFLKETSTLISKATEVVSIAGGNADQIAGLTTQMMASEAAITSVAPQLSGFTNELVSVLMNNNDATAVALRAIMNDINSDIGVSATSFMQSFMEDTQSTLSTAFAAIQRFIDQNENAASRQEFLHAMETVFGVQGSKLAQIDFGNVAQLLEQVNTNTNMAALTNAENLVRSGETTTLEEQLVANTANQLLATNAISATLDNKLMRKIEANELAMERLVYSAQATQEVELAENTRTFFTRITDLVTSILDPLGLFDMVTTKINAATSEEINASNYLIASTLSNIGSTVADSNAGMENMFANTVGGATAVIKAAQTKNTEEMAAAVERSGVTQSFQSMITDYSRSAMDAQAAIAASQVESNLISYSAMEQQARNSSEYQRRQDAAREQEAEYEEEKAAAREQQRIAQDAESVRSLENHDNLIIIRDALDSLDASEYLEPLLAEERTHTEQIKDLQVQTGEIVKLISTILEYSMVQSPEFASTISFDERSRIMDSGYVTNNYVPGF